VDALKEICRAETGDDDHRQLNDHPRSLYIRRKNPDKKKKKRKKKLVGLNVSARWTVNDHVVRDD